MGAGSFSEEKPMTYDYKIAGLRVHFQADFPLIDDECSALFRAEAGGQPDISVLVSAEETLPTPVGAHVADGVFVRLYQNGDDLTLYTLNRLDKTHCIRSTFPISGGTVHLTVEEKTKAYGERISNLWPAMDLPHQLLCSHVVVLHASAVKTEKGVIVFCAPSGTGKSTQAALWETHRGAEILNGDKVALSCRDGKVFAWGLPFCGTSHICKSYCLPVRGLVLLEQGQENTLLRLRGTSAAAALMNNAFGHNGLLFSREAMLRCLLPAAKAVPVFRLRCTPDQRAVDALAEAFKEESV